MVKLPKWKSVLEAISILVAVAAVVVYGGQLSVMNKQLAEMRGSGAQTDELIDLYKNQLNQLTKQATDTHELALAAEDQASASKAIATNAAVQAWASKVLAVQARRSGEVAQRSLQTTLDNFHQEQRAWLFPSISTSSEPDLIHPFTVTIGINNNGKTPAFHLLLASQIDVQYKEPQTPDFHSMLAPQSTAIITPGPASYTVKLTSSQFSQVALNAYHSGQTHIYIFGKLTYVDIFGSARWSTFCVTHSFAEAASGFQYCSSGNGVDHEIVH